MRLTQTLPKYYNTEQVSAVNTLLMALRFIVILALIAELKVDRHLIIGMGSFQLFVACH